MTSEEIETLAKEHFYVSNLVASKQLFGLQHKIGCLTDTGLVRVGTVKELIDIGYCEDEKFLIIDQFWSNLKVIS